MSLEDHLPKAPPTEVRHAFAVASEAYEMLSATGHQVHLGFDQHAGAVAVELRDLDGKPLSALAASDATVLAGGGEDL